MHMKENNNLHYVILKIEEFECFCGNYRILEIY